MNVTINSQLLAAELRLICKVTPAKPPIAALAYAMFTAEEGHLGLYATDLEVGLSTRSRASVHSPGSALLPAARLASLVERFTDGDVSLTTEGPNTLVRCGAFTSRLQTLTLNDFPRPVAAVGTVVGLDGAALGQLIARTRYAVSATATKHVLQGALLTMAGQVAAMVATDGRRIALSTVGREGSDLDVILSSKVLDLLTQQAAGEVTITDGTNHLFFTFGARTLTSRKLDGKFPNYRRIIPTNNKHVIGINRVEMTAALERVMVVAPQDNHAVYITLSPNSVELTSSSADVGSAAETLEVEHAIDNLKLCINGDYLLDFLSVANSNVVSLCLKDGNGAMLLKDGDDHIGVIMLMKG